MQNTIPTTELKPTDVPSPDAGWDIIGEFALTYDGYREMGPDRCAALANGETPPRTIDDYRAALFYEQRRWRHFGDQPGGEAMEGIRRLLDAIREMAAAPKSPRP